MLYHLFVISLILSGFSILGAGAGLLGGMVLMDAMDGDLFD